MCSYSVLFSSATTFSSSSASGLGPSGSGRSPQHQKPKSADIHGRVSAEGSCPLGCYWYTHPEQPAGHVLAAQVRQKHKSLTRQRCFLFFCQCDVMWVHNGRQLISSETGGEVRLCSAKQYYNLPFKICVIIGR